MLGVYEDLVSFLEEKIPAFPELDADNRDDLLYLIVEIINNRAIHTPILQLFPKISLAANARIRRGLEPLIDPLTLLLFKHKGTDRLPGRDLWRTFFDPYKLIIIRYMLLHIREKWCALNINLQGIEFPYEPGLNSRAALTMLIEKHNLLETQMDSFQKKDDGVNPTPEYGQLIQFGEALMMWRGFLSNLDLFPLLSPHIPRFEIWCE